MIHDLKILPEYFVEVVRGNKTFEVRKDDRPFNVGDELILYEVNCGKYTGRNIKVIITHILRNPDYCKEGYCILGFKQLVKHGRWVHDGSGHDRRDNWYHCSECNRALNLICGEKLEDYPYCHCGARMDLKDGDTNG